MIIALDYDETFTADKAIFTKIVELFIANGDSVTFVTYRQPKYNNEDIINDAHNLGIDIVFTSGRQKEHVFMADIWIDDSPVTIPSAESMCLMYDGCLVNNDMKISNDRK